MDIDEQELYQLRYSLDTLRITKGNRLRNDSIDKEFKVLSYIDEGNELNECSQVTYNYVSCVNKEQEFYSLIDHTELELSKLEDAIKLKKEYKEYNDLLNRRQHLIDHFSEYKTNSEKSIRKYMWLAYTGFAVVYILLIFLLTKNVSKDLPEIIRFLCCIIPSLIFSAIHFVVNSAIFEFLFRKDRERVSHLRNIDNEIKEIEKEMDKSDDWRKSCPTDEEIAKHKEDVVSCIKKLEEI